MIGLSRHGHETPSGMDRIVTEQVQRIPHRSSGYRLKGRDLGRIDS